MILPASAFPEKTGTFTNTDRRVQLGRTALPLPGEARLDWTSSRSSPAGSGCDWNYKDVGEVYAEMAGTMPSLQGITWERLEREGAVTYPADGDGRARPRDPLRDGFPTASGRGKLVPADVLPPDEMPDDEYPDGPVDRPPARALAHRRDDAARRRCSTSSSPRRSPSCRRATLERLGVEPRRPGPRLDPPRRDRAQGARRPRRAAGLVFIPFCYAEAAANLLTNPALDPFGKIPEFKFCAAQVEPLKATGRGGGAEWPRAAMV